MVAVPFCPAVTVRVGTDDETEKSEPLTVCVRAADVLAEKSVSP